VKPRFRTLAPSEVDGAFKGYLDVFEWLAAKGVRQWLRPLSREAFAERQAKGELFGYFVEEQLAAVVTIAFETSPYWLREAGSESRWWIKSLAVAPGFRHAGIGVRTLGECERHLLGCGARGPFLIVLMRIPPRLLLENRLLRGGPKRHHLSFRQHIPHGAHGEELARAGAGRGPRIRQGRRRVSRLGPTPMAGYSGTPLWKKLGYRDGTSARLDGGPKDYLPLLGLPRDVGVSWLDRSRQGIAFVHLFATSRAVLASKLASYRKAISADGVLWVSWPKKASGSKRTSPRT
jgi:GNAT superfamily N-acetyltransferase